jgi:hypothetical protein
VDLRYILFECIILVILSLPIWVGSWGLQVLALFAVIDSSMLWKIPGDCDCGSGA